MSIAILSAETGNGHIAVMNSLVEEFLAQEYNDLHLYPSFYEDLLFSYKIFSDFYNFLLRGSTELCAKFIEFSSLTRADLSDTIYMEIYDKLQNLINTKGLSAIISTIPTINHHAIKILKEEQLTDKIPFYIVITDPFNPIVSGFDVTGASKYFCATDTVKDILVKNGINRNSIEVTGFPVSPQLNKEYSAEQKELILKEMGLIYGKKTVLLNSGALGSSHYLRYLKIIVESKLDFQVIFMCGKNKLLLREANKFINSKNANNTVKILPFINNVEEVLRVADLVVTKPGANTFFECLLLEIPLIIDGAPGFLYQEKGVIDYLKKCQVGIVLHECDKLAELLKIFSDEQTNKKYINNISNMNIKNGTPAIVKYILSHL